MRLLGGGGAGQPLSSIPLHPWLLLRPLVLLLPLLATGGSSENKTRTCDVLIGIDEPLYDHYNKNLSQLVDLARDHITQVNHIYKEAVFVERFQDLVFRLARVQVMFGSCAAFRYENCTENREKFLEVFDQYNFSEFCLGYMLTFRDFDAGTAGLASIGTACRKEKNSGFVTFLNYNQSREMNDTVVTLAHELAHSLGSKHDEDYPDEECHSNYIMSSLLNDTVSLEFSNCSIKAMHSKLEEIVGNPDLNCFRESTEDRAVEVALCGNGIVEPGEQCDCGYDEWQCNDPCCYPAVISTSERGHNDTAQPCSRNQRKRCVTPVGLMYGVYIPLAIIVILAVLVTVLLRHDWSRDKLFFKHVTEGNIRIVNRGREGRRLRNGEGRRLSGQDG